MKLWQERLFLLIDEWLGVVLLIYLRNYQPRFFWPAFVSWAVMVYGVGYVTYFRRRRRELSR